MGHVELGIDLRDHPVIDGAGWRASHGKSLNFQANATIHNVMHRLWI
jgi:hypothetical protein